MFPRDAASRRELLSVIGQLAASQPDILVNSLLPCLLNSGVINKNGQPRCCSDLYTPHSTFIYKVKDRAYIDVAFASKTT